MVKCQMGESYTLFTNTIIKSLNFLKESTPLKFVSMCGAVLCVCVYESVYVCEAVSLIALRAPTGYSDWMI